MIYLFDKKLNLKKIISDPLESIQEWELNNLITLDVVIPYDKSHEGYSYVGHKLRNEFYLYKIRNEIKDDNTLKIKGVHILFDDLKGIVIKDKRYLNGENTMIVLKETLDESGWEVDGIGDIPDFKGNFYYKSVLSAFNKILEYTNIQYRPIIEFTNNKISRKTIKVSKKIGRDYGKWFEYGDKLVSVIAEQSHEDVYTAFIGRGKGLPTLDEEGIETGGYGRRITIKDVEWKISKGDPVDKPLGQEFIEIKEATELYGYPNGKPKTYVKNFENIEDEKELIQSTYEYAIENSRPKIQMKASAISDNPVEIGEIVAVINPKMNIRYKTIIFKIKTDLISGLQEFEFGEKIALSGVERTIQQEKRNEERLQEVKSILITRLENMGLDFFKKDGFPIVLEQNNKYNLPGGFYVFDRPIDKEPQSFVGIGGDGIIFANGKNLDGNWKIQTAIDGNGVAGESIITNSITANKLAPDVGQSLDLSSNVSITQMVKKDFVTKEEHKSSMKERDEVNAQKVSVDDYNQNNEIINQRMTYLEQTESSFELLFSSLKENIENNRVNIEELSAKIVSGMDEKGHTYTEWGSSDQLNKVRVGSDGISMISNEQKTMKLRDGVVEANSLYVTKTIGFGNHVAERYNEEFTLFRWTGGVL